jgi:AraC-like DNA-binding protein
VVDVRCRAHVQSHGTAEPNAAHQIVFVRRGLFTCTGRRGDLVADANQILFFNEGRAHRYAHPLPGGDDCTILALDEECAQGLSERLPGAGAADREGPFPLDQVPSTPRAARRHLELLLTLSSAEEPPALAVQEIVAELLEAATFALHGALATGAAKPAVVSAWGRERVEAAQVILNRSLAAPPSLAELATVLDCSPFHLSRIFRAATGLGLRHYLRRLRCRLAADRLRHGAGDLSDLALDLGFCDHSHFTNTFRREWGAPPSRLLDAVARGEAVMRRPRRDGYGERAGAGAE